MPASVRCCQFVRALELVDPALLDLVQRDRIEVVQLLPPAPHRADQVGGLQDGQMLGHRLTGHVDPPAQLPERLPVLLVQPVQQTPAGLVGQRLEDRVHP